jgi:hypothetical protein
VFGGVRASGEDDVLGGVEQGLARNAADVEAGAAEGGAFLDERDLEAELRGAEGAHVAAGAGADDDKIEGVMGKGHEGIGSEGDAASYAVVWEAFQRLSLNLNDPFGSDSDQEPGGILDGLLDLHEEGDGLLAVDEAVVVAEGEIHHRADDDLAVDGDRALVDGVQAEDGALRRR